ncbi:MAG: hypothetical protein QOI10_684 [Solirubrobacterales bacterium]|nr:hypothetical protein [Solirubrobacterales bacterium]
MAGLLAPLEVVGHALVGRQDLPIPEWLFAWAASAVLIVSFFALSVAWHQTRFEEAGWRAVRPWISRALVNRGVEVACGAFSVFLLGVTIWSGLNGTEAPDRNFAVTFAYVTVWLGFVVLSVAFGDVFRAFNPWRAIARVVGGLFKLIAGQSAPAPLAYPERLGRWPAAFGLVAVVWLELVYGQGGFQTVGLTPHTVAVAVLAYSAYTFVAMTLFGSEKWLERGETFSVYFHMFSTLSAFEVRERKLGLRRMLSATTTWVAEAPGSIALVLFTIGATTFDGAGEGTLASPIRTVEGWFTDLGVGPLASLRISNSIFLVLSLSLVCGLYWAGIYGMHTVRTKLSTLELGRLFAHAFIPIALAYLVAHYFSLVVFQEQAQFSFLLSDPLGDGSNIFGTANHGIDYGAISANAIWYVQVGALIAGHVTALVLGHDRALKIYGDTRLATRSQYWMLALMVGFTSLGLFLLSQSNG